MFFNACILKNIPDHKIYIYIMGNSGSSCIDVWMMLWWVVRSGLGFSVTHRYDIIWFISPADCDVSQNTQLPDNDTHQHKDFHAIISHANSPLASILYVDIILNIKHVTPARMTVGGLHSPYVTFLSVGMNSLLLETLVYHVSWNTDDRMHVIIRCMSSWDSSDLVLMERLMYYRRLTEWGVRFDGYSRRLHADQ